MISDIKKRDLEKQGYRLVGRHSAIKVCEWCKKSLRDCGFCYKEKFYGIKSHRCVQMTPALPFCDHRCIFCWRDIEHTYNEWNGGFEEPRFIVDECIKKHVEFLQGFGGNKGVNRKKFDESMEPNQFAISLAGEPTFYPKIGELIDEIVGRGMTAFLVTNGTNPDVLRKLLKHEPTNLYITLPAPNEKVYSRICKPLVENGWERIMESLRLMKDFKCKKVIRLTLVKGENMCFEEEYAEILKQVDFDFVEFKAYMYVGYSQLRLGIENMPRHPEVKDFASRVCEKAGINIIDEKEESRVVLGAK